MGLQEITLPIAWVRWEAGYSPRSKPALETTRTKAAASMGCFQVGSCRTETHTRCPCSMRRRRHPDRPVAMTLFMPTSLKGLSAESTPGTSFLLAGLQVTFTGRLDEALSPETRSF